MSGVLKYFYGKGSEKLDRNPLKAVTFSFDDGVEDDKIVVDILNRYGLKGTFNIKGGLYAPEGTVYKKGTIHRRMTKKQCQELYKDSGMEVAVHGYTHPFLEQLPPAMCTYEVLQDRTNLETEYGQIVRGMAYPYGTYNDDVVEAIKACGIVYARTIETTGKFSIPTDWLRLKPTCHHADPKLMQLAHDFVEKGLKIA